MPVYPNTTFYAASGSAFGAAPTWASPSRAASSPDNSFTLCLVSGGTTSALLYTSGFSFNLPPTTLISSGFINILHRQPSGSTGATVIGKLFAGLSPSTDTYFHEASENVTPGSAFTLVTYSLPTELLTPTILNDSRFYCGLNYSGQVSQGPVDVDSIYITLHYVVPDPFYLTTSIMRTGALYRKL